MNRFTFAQTRIIEQLNVHVNMASRWESSNEHRCTESPGYLVIRARAGTHRSIMGISHIHPRRECSLKQALEIVCEVKSQ